MNWEQLIKEESKKDYYRDLMSFVDDEYSKGEVFPPRDKIFTALESTPLENVKCVILGQDPYHDVGQAHGMAFSVNKGIKIPPSLVNIYKELHDELGTYIPDNGYLMKWAEQGVLLLNTVLTVRAHEANSHKGKGWEKFTDRVISEVGKKDEPVVFMLWGKPAQTKKKLITNPAHLVLESVHPSPLSVYRGFYGCGHFVKCNEFLKENGIKEIDWQIENDQASLSNLL
ncbi:Uracil-DNA glycosylase [Ruminococcaceae bacterium KH2T8]|nr:Uracil-DNA glycosylase [Ruminococcaceae bacterium KH2T8]